jgi:hypothetical protein
MITGAETVHLLGRDPMLSGEARMPLVPAGDVMQLGLREDQVVRAVVEARGDRLQLLLDGRPVMAAMNVLPAAGTDIRVSVHLLPDGSAALRPIPAAPGGAAVNPAAGAASAAPLPASPASAAVPYPRLEQLLWRPGGMQALLDLLHPSGLLQHLPATVAMQPEIVRLLGDWQRARPAMASLSDTTLRAAVSASGFFTEASVARGDTGVHDLKSLLRQLLLRVVDAAPEGARPLTEAVHDIEAAQLRSVENLLGGQSSLQMALAFSDAPPVRLDLSRADVGDDEGGSVWFIDMHSASDRLGELWLASKIASTSRVDMTVWASRQDVCDQARQRHADLVHALGEWNLELGSFRVLHGRRPAAASDDEPPPGGRLVDLRA